MDGFKIQPDVWSWKLAVRSHPRPNLSPRHPGFVVKIDYWVLRCRPVQLDESFATGRILVDVDDGGRQGAGDLALGDADQIAAQAVGDGFELAVGRDERVYVADTGNCRFEFLLHLIIIRFGYVWVSNLAYFEEHLIISDSDSDMWPILATASDIWYVWI